jgi:outer membrane biogenesis lipoprotein LolB
VRTPEGGDIARLRWTHRPLSDLWVISSPVGNEIARIEATATGARLERADGPPEEAPSFAALSERLLGAPIEPRSLAQWLHGLEPAAGPGGWQVSIDERRNAGRMDLARRITATRGEVVVKLVVDDYRALDP